MSKSEVFNEDCMIGMHRYPDKYFDLAVVDPPYGGRGGKASKARSDSAGASTATRTAYAGSRSWQRK